MTKDEIKKKYDKLRYNDDGTMKSADQLGDASKFGDAANKVFPNQNLREETYNKRLKNPTNAATGGVNPRAGTYAAELKRTTDALSSNFEHYLKAQSNPQHKE